MADIENKIKLDSGIKQKNNEILEFEKILDDLNEELQQIKNNILKNNLNLFIVEHIFKTIFKIFI